MVKLTRRKAIGGVGGIILLGACTAAMDPDGDAEASADAADTGDDDIDSIDDVDEADDMDEADDANGEDVVDESENEESTPEVEEPETQSFSGSGATVDDGVDIEGGLTVVDASHTGESNFQVHLVGGEFDDLFVNEIGNYEGETAGLIDAGTYRLDIEADGDWSIEIRQPRANSGDSLPQSVSGNEPEVFGPFEFGGSHVASGSHSGDSNFQVHVYPLEGSFAGELVFNEIGEYSGETTFRHDGIGYVAVVADGEFSVDIE
jgi:hypothetical protein